MPERSVRVHETDYSPLDELSVAFISMLHHWLRATDGNGSTVRTALLDYRKAFDLVDDHLLIAKLLSHLPSIGSLTSYGIGSKGSNLTTTAIPAG